MKFDGLHSMWFKAFKKITLSLPHCWTFNLFIKPFMYLYMYTGLSFNAFYVKHLQWHLILFPIYPPPYNVQRYHVYFWLKYTLNMYVIILNWWEIYLTLMYNLKYYVTGLIMILIQRFHSFIQKSNFAERL